MTNWFPESSSESPLQTGEPMVAPVPPPENPPVVENPPKEGPSWSVTILSVGVIIAVAVSIFALVINLRSDDTETIVREVVPASSQTPVSGALEANTGVTSARAVENSPADQPIDGTGLTVIEQASRKVVEATVKIETTSSGGSGFFYDESGLILTAAHVLLDGNGNQHDTVIVGITKDGNVARRVEGRVLGVDSRKDIGVIKIDMDEEFQVAELGVDSSVRIGETVFAVGSPFGLDNTVTRGIVSFLNRTLTNPSTGEAAGFNLIQTDTPINPGNSGGPLANLNGEIIGINILIQNAGLSGGNVGVGFAVPIAQAKEVADAITAGESEAELGFLGIRGRTSEIGRAGAFVVDVTPGEPADRAGLRANDLIISVDDREIYTFNELLSAVQLHSPNDSISLEVLRIIRNDAGEAINEEILTLSLVLGAVPTS